MLNRRILKLRRYNAFFVFGLMVACGGSRSAAPSASVSPESSEPAPGAVPLGAKELVGTVIKKPWTKSAESWNAGGSDYFVLDVGDAPVEKRTAAEGVLLIPAGDIRFEGLEAWVGKRVMVRGDYVEGRPPKIPERSQFPTGPDGEPAPQGAGFEVLMIDAAD